MLKCSHFENTRDEGRNVQDNYTKAPFSDSLKFITSYKYKYRY